MLCGHKNEVGSRVTALLSNLAHTPAEATSSFSLPSASTDRQLVALKPLGRVQLWVSGVLCCCSHTINAPRKINGMVLLFLGIIVAINN